MLVVEDDDDLRDLIVQWLRRFRDLTVLPARDGAEAREWAARDDLRIDVAVIDIVLPDTFGSQIAIEQTFLRPNLKTIYMSGHTPHDAVLAATLKDRTIRFLEKPFSLNTLAQTIDSALAESERERRSAVHGMERRTGGGRRQERRRGRDGPSDGVGKADEEGEGSG